MQVEVSFRQRQLDNDFIDEFKVKSNKFVVSGERLMQHYGKVNKSNNLKLNC